MYLIQEILVSDEVFTKKFVCHIDKCKGACCWEGDYGAPVADSEIEQIQEAYPFVKPYLSQNSIDRIEQTGNTIYDKGYGGVVTPLMDDGSCAYLFKNEKGEATCSFQQAKHDDKIDFVKPISCQLYPLRVKSNEESGFEAINYDEWDICSPACDLGEELSMPVFRFVKDALIRKYGQEFYDEMERVNEHKA